MRFSLGFIKNFNTKIIIGRSLNTILQEMDLCLSFVLQRLSAQQVIGFLVFCYGLFYHILREGIALFGIGLEPVAHELLVEGGLILSGLVAFQGPEAAAVGGEHLVCQDQLAVFVQAYSNLVSAMMMPCSRA